jgi:hypothetical protein
MTVEQIMQDGTFIGRFEEWELWLLDGVEWHVNVKEWRCE